MNSVGSALARRATSCSSRGVDTVRLATTSTRLGDEGSMAPSSEVMGTMVLVATYSVNPPGSNMRAG